MIQVSSASAAEHIQIAAQIMVSCSLLGGRDHFLVPHGQQLVAILQQLIGNLSEKGMHLLIPVLNVVLQIIPEEGPELLKPALKTLLNDILSNKEPSTVVAGNPPPLILPPHLPPSLPPPSSLPCSQSTPFPDILTKITPSPLRPSIQAHHNAHIMKL